MIKWLSVLCIALLITSCKKPFDPAGALASTNRYLVIDGVVNTGNDSTFINLSRTKKFDTVIKIDPEVGAKVSVESSTNTSYPLTEIKAGQYAAAPLNLDNTRQYRVRIKTTDGKEYLSDFVTVKNSPPIDSVGFTAKSTNVIIYVNSHDATSKTNYYRWEYAEAWQFHTTYRSNWDGYVRRGADDQVYFCFSNDTSSYINLASTTQLTKDEVYQAPVVSIPSSSEKIQIKYSILVKQFALTPDAYNFWNNLHKNNETRGSIFDAQPSENQTNYHCLTNPTELVVGYLSAGSVASKRVFITRAQLPASYDPRYLRACDIDSAFYFRANQQPLGRGTPFTTVDALFFSPFPPMGVPSVLLYTTNDCADCTTRGVVKAPYFWK
jgi:hypothetical protein